MHQRRRNRGIHSAGKRADSDAIAHLLANLLQGMLDECLRHPVRPSPADFKQKVRQYLFAMGGVADLRVKLHSEDFLRRVLDCAERVSRAGRKPEARWEAFYFISM